MRRIDYRALPGVPRTLAEADTLPLGDALDAVDAFDEVWYSQTCEFASVPGLVEMDVHLNDRLEAGIALEAARQQAIRPDEVMDVERSFPGNVPVTRSGRLAITARGDDSYKAPARWVGWEAAADGTFTFTPLLGIDYVEPIGGTQ